MLNANLSPKIKEFEPCLHNWSRWKLSLLGKITVLKSFAVPKLIYPLTVLQSPDQVCINKIKKTMFQFLWDNKPDKISRDKIIQDYGHGGLKMLDIDKFIQSIKCSWVKRIKLQPYSKWVQLYETMLNKYGKQFLFKSNLNSQDMEKLEIKSRFLKDILVAWSYANFKDEISFFGKEIIWNNTNIKTKTKPFLLYNWLEKGIVFIEHIYDYRNKRFYSFDEVQNLYNVPQTDFFSYHQIIACIPTEWKNKLKEEEMNYRAPEYLFEKLVPQLKTCRFIYNILLKKITNIQSVQETKWEDKLSSELDWKNIFRQILKITIDTKLRSFQYKYLMHIVPNNEKLFKYGMIESSLCDFCNSSTESNIHLFWECSYIQPFWCEITRFLNERLNILDGIALTYQSISFCNVDINNTIKSNCVNYIILLGKYFIFKNKYQKTTPNFNEFRYYLNHNLNLEGIIAEMKGKTDAHQNKWNSFKT